MKRPTVSSGKKVRGSRSNSYFYGDKVELPGALYVLQTQLGLNVHPGGKTPLELKGYAHYLPCGKRKLFLYGTQGLVFPTWFKCPPNIIEPSAVDGGQGYECITHNSALYLSWKNKLVPTPQNFCTDPAIKTAKGEKYGPDNFVFLIIIFYFFHRKGS